MTICFGDWKLTAYQGDGHRCWAVSKNTKNSRPMRYYDSVGRAIEFCAEYDLRNKVQGTYDLADALIEYRRILDGFKASLERF